MTHSSATYTKRVAMAIVAVGVFLSATPAYAVTVNYQPTPFPSGVTNGIHVWDGWITNVFYGQVFIQDDKLQQGGWGDVYRTYVKFDTKGLPTNVSQAVLWMWPYAVTNATVVNFYQVNANWTTSMTWGTQPSATLLGSRGAPTVNQWWGTIITQWYNPWASNPTASYGLRIDPQLTNNNFNFFRSSRYTTSSTARPILGLTFTPPVSVPSFLMPLPGQLAWLVTTDVGGWDCVGNTQDTAHDGLNYFSIDYSWKNITAGDTPYGQNDNIPIIAAAGGKVVTATFSSANGYYVVVDHDGDGNLATGFSTRYLHFKTTPSVSVGQTVAQGDLLGYMGNTGQSSGIHLHFGTRHADSGTWDSNGKYVVNNGWLLKGFQTECTSGTPTRYYTSSNRVY